jgi:hypothetical protein
MNLICISHFQIYLETVKSQDSFSQNIFRSNYQMVAWYSFEVNGDELCSRLLLCLSWANYHNPTFFRVMPDSLFLILQGSSDVFVFCLDCI